MFKRSTRSSMLPTIFAAVLTLALFAGNTFAQQQTLELGDQAPGLDIETWVKGPEVVIEPGNVYIMFFFQTTDAITDRLMLDFSKIDSNMRSEGLVVVGISDEEGDVIQNYVRGRGSQISFPIAADNRGATKRNWFTAADLTETPAVIIVDKRGIIQYIGKPTDRKLTNILKLILTKRYDAKLYDQAEPVLKAISTARQQRNWRVCMKYIDDLLEKDKYAFAPLALDKYEMILVDQNDKEGAAKYGQEVLVQFADDPELLCWMAEKVATDPKIPNELRDLDYAQQAIDVAWPKLSDKDPDNFAMAATIRYHRGEYDKAVQLQRKAYFLAQPYRKEAFQNTLKTYMASARSGTKATEVPSQPPSDTGTSNNP